MGVRGLSKFVDECYLSRGFELLDTSVIIDGCSLMHYLYAKSGADCMYGGDYDVYAVAVQNYFSCLEECNIKPIVIFDGGYDKSDRMLKKLLERQLHKLEDIRKLLRNGESTSEILPINAYEVFKNVLSEMGILYAQCDYEGDNQMASLATHYNCPILSEDSDFYIYDLPNGFIRINVIEDGVKTKTLPGGLQKKYLSCKIYYLKTLLSVYRLQDNKVLPLLATLAGNDYASPYDEFKQFYYKTRIRKNFEEKFHGLFAWLRNKTLDEAKREVLDIIGRERREEIKSIIENSIEDYEIKPTNMVNILSSLNSNDYDAVIQETKLISPCGKSLPGEFVVAFHKGQLSSTLLNIITLRRNILLPQFDDFSQCSSYICSRYIRQVIYGILLQHDSLNFGLHARTCLRGVEEKDRVGINVSGFQVQFFTTLQNGVRVPKLSEIYNMQKNQLRDFMGSIMEVNTDSFIDIPSNLQLFFICVHYWLLKSLPKPQMECLQALILGIIYFHAKETIFHNLSNGLITLSAANLVHGNLKRYLQEPSNRCGLIVHSFNQLQACILDCTSLNSLMNAPFEPPKLHKLFNGKLFHNLAKDLQSKPNNKSFFRQLLGMEASQTYFMLIQKFIENNSADPI